MIDNLAVPINISIMPLPPKCPEINPTENNCCHARHAFEQPVLDFEAGFLGLELAGRSRRRLVFERDQERFPTFSGLSHSLWVSIDRR